MENLWNVFGVDRLNPICISFYRKVAKHICHRADENRPEVGDSKPATLK